MPKRVIFTILFLTILTACGKVVEWNEEAANKRLSAFTGYPTEYIWVETSTEGETFYFSRWQRPDNTECSAVISEKDEKYHYNNEVVCFTPAQSIK